MHGTQSRLRQRGNSFTSCLLTLIIVFGGLGFYYFNYFQWRHFEAPLEGLTFEDETPTPQLNDFRKKTLSAVADPIGGQLERLAALRKKVKKAGFKAEGYPELEQDCTEVRNRLKEIMVEARLRRIPKKFKPKYEPLLLALQDAYRSVNYLAEVFDPETEQERMKLYDLSLKETKEGYAKLRPARAYFSDEGDWKL